MTLYELFDLANSAANRADIQWGLFITIHMAIFGGIVYVDRPLRRSEKTALLTVYSGFAAVNYLVTKTQLNFVNLINQEIARLATDPCCLDSLLVNRIVERLDGSDFVIGMNILTVSHLFMAVLVLLAVIFDKRLTDFVKVPDE